MVAPTPSMTHADHMSNWLNVASLIVGPGGLLGGVGAAWWGSRKSKVDNATALTTGALGYAGELRKDLDTALRRIDTLESRLNARDAAVVRHMPWDWHVYRSLRDLGQPIDEPPPLLPTEQY